MSVRQLRAIGGVVDVKPALDATDPYSQLLYGELFEVDGAEGEWLHGRCVHDRYEGWVHRDQLSEELVAPTHTVKAMWAPIVREPLGRMKPHSFLTLSSRIRVVGQRDQFYALSDSAWVYKAHVTEGELRIADYVSVAERMVGVPFVWGGRSTYGFDCCGLVQFALGLAGIAAPRDVPEQATMLGRAVDLQSESPRRGDLFYVDRRGQVSHGGMFVSDTDVIHSGHRFAGVGIETFSGLRQFYRLMEQVNGTLETLRFHVRRIEP